MYNKSRLFIASCLALVTTAFAFSIRAGILNELGIDMELNKVQLGFLNQMAFFGFPAATIIGGYLYNVIGAKKMIWLAFIFHAIGIVSTIIAPNYIVLLFSSFFIGFANGTVEAACNPLVASMYKENQTTMLNRFHVWFPGGVAIGALLSYFMGVQMGVSWQVQIALMLVPTIIYGFLFWGQHFPKGEEAGEQSVGSNIKGMLNPLFFFMLGCMILTANTELSTQQWIEFLLKVSSSIHPLLILALITGLMGLGRLFAGPVVHSLNPIGVLFFSAIIAFGAIFLMSKAEGNLVYVSAVLFAIGVCYFWPTMLGFVAEYIPKSGALGLSIIGGMGMLATGIMQPIVGAWIQKGEAIAKSKDLVDDAAQLVAGQYALTNLVYFPAILIVAFGILFVMRGKLEEQRTKH
jgi:MFS family permease